MTAQQTPAGQRCDVLFYVQHLLGIGHLRRAAVIARALDRAGLRVAFVSGGLPDPDLDIGGARLWQLAPARVRDESFAQLIDAEGRAVSEAWRAERRFHLLRILETSRPRVLLTEMFPFGRRQMRFELLPLLQAARKMRPRPWIVSSLRDVLTTHRTPGKTEWILDTFARFYDLVLVHGDPKLIPLERSFPRAREIADRLRYTGYVVERAPAPPGGARGPEVLVSTGGGAVARPLVEAALAARALSPLAAAPWHVLIGHGLDQAGFAALRDRAPAGVAIERSRPDFTALLARAALSISQAGYNTTLEVLAAGTPAIVVPFAAGSETEQSLRAELLAARGLLTVVPEAELSAPRLAEAIAASLAQPRRRAALDFDLAGAEKTAALLREFATTAIVPS